MSGLSHSVLNFFLKIDFFCESRRFRTIGIERFGDSAMIICGIIISPIIKELNTLCKGSV